MLLCAVSFGAYAQQKGDMYIGSMVGVGLTSSSIYYDGEKQNNYDPSKGISVSPEFQYFVADKFRLGFLYSFGVDKNHFERAINKSSYIFDTKKTYFAIGPSFAKYIRMVDNFYYVLELGACYIHSQSRMKGEYIRRDYVSFNELNLGTGQKSTYRSGFAVNLLDLSFSRFIMKEKPVIVIGEENRLPKVYESHVNFSVGVNPAFGVHLYF